jgi:hypothetical protein
MQRLYVLVSKELDPIYASVQGGHAVAQWLLDNKETQTWNNNYLIYVSADIPIWKLKLQLKELPHSVFYEPDLGDIPTAIAIENDGYLFRNLKKLVSH